MKEYTLTLPENYTPPPLPGRDEWIAALRSGDYAQTRGRLHNSGRLCCLGVLCKIQGRLNHGHDGPLSDGCINGLHVDNLISAILGSEGFLPENLTLRVGVYSPPSLASANDSGLSFSQIADIIEQAWSDGGPLLK